MLYTVSDHTSTLQAKKIYFVVALIAMKTELAIFAWESFKLTDDHENLEIL